MRGARPVAVVFALAACLAAPPAGAQPSSPDSIDVEFRRGLALYDGGDFSGAAAVWEALVAKNGEGRAWKVLYNLGLAYQAGGDPTKALTHYEAFVGSVARQPEPLAPSLAERRQDAAERAAALRAAHGALDVRAPAHGPAAEVRVDGGAPRRAGFVVLLVPGDHTVELTGSSGAVRKLDVRAVGGQTLVVDATPPEPPAPPPHPPAPAPSPGPSFPTWWVVGGAALTAASIALPIVLRSRAEEDRAAAAKLGAGHTDYAAARDDYDASRSLYYVSFAVPATLGAVTVAIAVVALARGSRETSSPPGSQTTRRESAAPLGVALVPLASGAGAVAWGAY